MSKEATRTALLRRITSYLVNGGMFNPEMMEHDKVRDLIMDLEDYIEYEPEPQKTSQEIQHPPANHSPD